MASKHIQIAAAGLLTAGCIFYIYTQVAPKRPTGPPTDTVKELPVEIREALSEESIAVLDGKPSTAERDAGAAAPTAAPLETAQSGDVISQYSGNGRDKLRLTAWNKGAKPTTVSIGEGTLFESGSSTVVVLRPASIEIAPGATANLDLETAATSSFTDLSDREFEKSQGWLPGLDPLLRTLKGDPNITTASAQTAVLAVMENAPLDLFAKFSRLKLNLPDGANADAFRVPTSDIVGALKLLRDAGLSSRQFALGTDSQLVMEAMIDANAHDEAAAYFAIEPNAEWEFWKSQLLGGDIATRHYALFGIAQHFPDVALVMLPEWAREKKLRSIYRLSAVQALAMTERAEAIPILREIAADENAAEEIRKSAKHSIDYLEFRIANGAADSDASTDNPDRIIVAADSHAKIP